MTIVSQADSVSVPVFPVWASPEVRQYLAHTAAGISLRDLARKNACYASTMMRRIRKIEQQRDDPLVDAAIRRMEARLQDGSLDLSKIMKKELDVMKSNACLAKNPDEMVHFNRESARVLRRLCETGAVLAIAADMEMAVVVRESPDGSSTRTAVVSQEIAQGMAVKGWIETKQSGRILRYTITPTGRDEVKAQLDQVSQSASMELAEAPGHFAPANSGWTEVMPAETESESRRHRYNLAESPLTALARRRDKTGEPFLDETLVRAGERLREDFELAQMGTQTDQNWLELVAGSTVPDNETAVGFGPDAAQSRVVAALGDLGPGLSDVALRCCCYLEGLESAEKRMGWSARSGKIVLRIALQRLKRHYSETLTDESQMIG